MTQDTGWRVSLESSKLSNILKLWCYWKNDRLNHVFHSFREIYKNIDTDIKAT